MIFAINSKKYGLKEVLIDDDDYDRIKDYSWCFMISDNRPYALTRFYTEKQGKNILLHRFIMDCPDNMVIDHINHNTLDNRKCNLRICTDKENSRNSKKPDIKCSSKYKGVCFCKQTKLWTSQIMVNRKYIWLKRHKTEELAALAYNEAAIKYFDKFACLNEIKHG